MKETRFQKECEGQSENEALIKWLPGVLTKARMLTVKTKQCDPKEPVTVTQFALQSNCVGDGAIYSRTPNCCERKWGG